MLGVREWETLLGQARQARLLARVAAHYLDKGWLPAAPDGPRRHLEGALRLADRQQHEVRWELDCISRALSNFGGPVVLLKGAAYLMANLPPSRGRLFADIDLMVPREKIEPVEGSLLAAGWISDERDPYNQRYYREWMHEIPPLRHVQRNTYIDLHHTITPPTSRFHVSGDKLLARIKSLNGHADMYVLSPVDMVLHSAVHLFQEGDFGHGLRDLLDLNDLLQHFGLEPEFWGELLNRADDLGLQIPLFHALLHIRRLFGTVAPLDLVNRVWQFGPNSLSRALMAWLLGLALKPDHPSCNTRFTALARWLLYVRSHALRMPPNLLVSHLVRKAWMRRFPEQGKLK
ncbi:MAG: nucleotidyltransferase family protein [Pirellulaceae bacterium]|nr:nucleotidyltransferase family protein [Pirellulaceae bacterium]